MRARKKQIRRGVTPPRGAEHKRVESEMSYLTQVVNQRPMLRITAEVVLVFCCAAPLVLALSSLVAYGVQSVMH